MNQTLRRVLISLGIFLLLLIGLWLWGRSYLDNKIGDLIAAANRGEDSLSVEQYDFSLRPFVVDLRLGNLFLDQTFAGRNLSGRVDSLELKGLSIFSFLGNGPKKVKELWLNHPDLQLRQVKSDSLPPADSTSGQLRFQLDRLHLERAQLTQLDDNGEPTLRLVDADLRKTDLSFPFQQREDLGSTLMSWDSLLAPLGPHDLVLLGGNWSTDSSQLRLESLRLSPLNTAAASVLDPQSPSDWLAVRMDGLTFSDFEPQSLIDTQWLNPDRLRIDRLNLILASPVKPLPAADRERNMPVQSLRALPLPFYLNEVRIDHFDIEYRAMESTDSVAVLHFRDGSVSVSPVTNQTINGEMRASVSCHFNDMTELQSELSFDLSGDGRDWTATGELGTCQLDQINPFLDLAANAQIKEGTLLGMSYQLSSDGTLAEGEMRMPYENLRIRVTGGRAWYANIFKGIVFKNHNMPPDIRVGNIYHEHEPGRSFFNLWWKGILSGLKSSTLGDVALPSELH